VNCIEDILNIIDLRATSKERKLSTRAANVVPQAIAALHSEFPNQLQYQRARRPASSFAIGV
jgi:hypothetical protein